MKIKINNQEFIPHKFQEKILLSDKRYILFLSGIQGGKSTGGVFWLLWQIQKNPKGTFLVGAPNYKQLQASTFEKFSSIVGTSLGTFHKFDQMYKLKSGGKIFFRSLDDPDRGVEGITANAAWLDEAGIMKKRAWINCLGRVSATRGKVLLTTTPYHLNWLYKDIYKPWLQKQKGFEHFDIIQFRSIDSPYFAKESYDQAELLLSKAEFERRYCGQFRKMTDLVYQDLFDDEGDFRHGVLVDEMPQFKEVIAGIDWGYLDPTAIPIMGITEDGHLYVFDEIYKTGMTLDEIKDVLLEKRMQNRISYFYADSAQPSNIRELNMKGIPVIPANKDIVFGISQLRSFIRAGKFHIMRRCTNTQEEFTTYKYKESDKVIEEPEDNNNHLMDGIRYIVNTHPQIANIVPTPIKEDLRDKETIMLWEDVKKDVENIKRIPFTGDYADYDIPEGENIWWA